MKALYKYLNRDHPAGCAWKRFSDGKKRHCSCGRDEAKRELIFLLRLVGVLFR